MYLFPVLKNATSMLPRNVVILTENVYENNIVKGNKDHIDWRAYDEPQSERGRYKSIMCLAWNKRLGL